MASGRPHSDETRAAVLAALLAGQGVMEVARQFNLNHKTIIEWRNRAGLKSTPVPRETHDQIGEQVIGVLQALLSAVQNIAGQSANTAWRDQQTAADLGSFLGIQADKAFRILAALEEADERASGLIDQDVGGGET